MKKLIWISLVVSFFFTACKKEYDNVFDKSPDERINEALTSYQSTLTGATNGWKAFITTDSGKGSTYGFYFKFSADNRVSMYSDFDTTSAVTLQTSSYRLKAEQQPTLIFDTYSYVHVLADPNESVALTDNYILFSDVNYSQGGEIGQGLLSDFEFIIDNAKIRADTFEVIGKVNGAKLVLVKATKAEEDAYNAGQLNAGLSINKILTYFKRLTIGSQLYDIRIDASSRQFVFSWLDASGNLQTFTTGYYFVPGGIVFTTPFVNGGQTITGFTNISFNAGTQTITLNVNSNTSATITGIVVPLKVDVGAPKRWYNYAYNNGREYWAALTGFHVNGVDDAFNVKQIPDYQFMIFWPAFGTSGATTYDLAGFVTEDSSGLALNFGAAYRAPNFTTDGRVTFSLLGTLGTVPPEAQAAYDATSAKFAQSGGYYLIQTSDITYDMVAVSDARSWISWLYPF